jgi:uncharacterized protein (TIGR00369 family)
LVAVFVANFLREESNVTEGSDKTQDSRDEHRLMAIGREGMPVGKLIGFKLLEAGDGRAVVTLEAGPQHTNPMGTLHGGILCDIADAAMGIAFNSTLAATESFTTVELKINFFRPVWKAELRAEGKVVRRGKTVGYVECEVTDENGRAVAKASSTCLVLRGKEAEGR